MRLEGKMDCLTGLLSCSYGCDFKVCTATERMKERKKERRKERKKRWQLIYLKQQLVCLRKDSLCTYTINRTK